uniref:TauD/TfdA-like domain-containing protein n=1 Tax=Chrysotila carterae TaxID=13221 RepID=A0A7S4F0R0_CHRCT
MTSSRMLSPMLLASLVGAAAFTMQAAHAPRSALTLSTRQTPQVASRAGRVRAVAELIRTDAPAAKSSLSGALPDCPTTIWDTDELDIKFWQDKYKSEEKRACPIEVVATPEANAAGAEYFKQRKAEFASMLEEHGTIWFKGFDLMKDPAGFRSFWESLELDPCLDPIHTSGLRKFLSKKDGIYEEVNKQALSKHYIGLHNESTFKKTAKSGAFVCFKPATVSGGEFLIADGEAIFRDLDPEILAMLCERKVRISVSNLDLDVLGNLPEDIKKQAMNKVGELVDANIAPKFDMDLDMIWGTDGKDLRLQAIEHAQSPVNRHPVTKRPVWFCNMHNHARFLRDRRPCSVPEVGMTDVYFGDLSIIPGDVLQKVNEVCEANIVRVPMQPGDVLLCDNYRVLHGRDIFEGERLHAVSWFGDESTAKAKAGGTGDLLNSIINNFVVGN